MTSVTLYGGFLTLLALERLAELGLSARNARRAFAQGAVEVGQRHYRVMAVLHTAFLVCCAGEVVLLHRPFTPTWGLLALTGAMGAQALRYWAIFSLGERWNTRIIVLPGATPVKRGPYRFLRHPNYVAVVLELLCVPLIHGAFLTAASFTVANALLLRVRIAAEEEALGLSYAELFAHTPRFLPELHRDPTL